MTKKLSPAIIALDLDDTLLREDLTISDYSVGLLQRAVKSGIYIVLASGRTDNAILPYIRRLDIAGTQQGRFMIPQNGASVFDLHARLPIYSRCVEPDVLLHVFEAARKNNLGCEVYDESTIYAPAPNKWTDIDAQLSGLKIHYETDFARMLGKGFPKMVIPGDPAVVQRMQAQLRSELGERAVIFTSKPYFLEILPPLSGKGEALSFLCNHLGIPQEKTMAFGDGMNDESMIRYAHDSVGMLNGCEEIKSIARHVTEYTNNEDGAPRFIEKYVNLS